MRAIGGILAGLIVGLLVTILIGVVGGIFFPVSAGSPGFSRPQQVVDAFAEMPQGLKIVLMLAWFGGTLAGAAVAKRISGSGWVAWTVTGLIAAYVLANVLVLPMPGWMQALSVAAPLLGGFIANHLVGGRTAAAESETASERQQL
ncbi:MAG TPA: hypothetical protein VES64_04460 [Allosphingosinicella sp.]|nr:hypothetical protein [Allosphingosinicella sp.]